MIVQKILKILWAVFWRITLTAAVAVLLLVLGINMVLSTVLRGPSVTARNALVMTLMEYEQTAHLPGRFLDSALVMDICRSTDTLPAETSDPSLIVPSSGAEADDCFTIDDRVAHISVTYTDTILPESEGAYWAGFNEDGILVISTVADAGLAGRCEKILILNGQTNTGLYEGNTGYTPRLAIGQCADGAVIRVTMENGSYQDLVDIMTEYGAVNACLLSCNEE